MLGVWLWLWIGRGARRLPVGLTSGPAAAGTELRSDHESAAPAQAARPVW